VSDFDPAGPDAGDVPEVPEVSAEADSAADSNADANSESESAAETSRRPTLSAVPPLPPTFATTPAAAAYAGTRPTPYGSAPYAGQAEPAPARSRRVFEMADLWTAVLGTIAVVAVGAIAGLIWFAIAPRAAAVRNNTSFGTIDPYTKAFVRDDITFLAVTLVAGVLCAVVAGLIARHRGVAVAISMAVGGFAASYLAGWLGRYLTGGPALTWADHTSVGNHPYFIDVTDRQFLLGWPLAALAVTFLIALAMPPQPESPPQPPRWPVEL
jgi:hypothetical protein